MTDLHRGPLPHLSLKVLWLALLCHMLFSAFCCFPSLNELYCLLLSPLLFLLLHILRCFLFSLHLFPPLFLGFECLQDNSSKRSGSIWSVELCPPRSSHLMSIFLAIFTFFTSVSLEVIGLDAALCPQQIYSTTINACRSSAKKHLHRKSTVRITARQPDPFEFQVYDPRHL